MMLVGFFCLFVLSAVDVASSEKLCSYQDVLNHLNLTKNNELFFMTRPVKDYRLATNVSLDILLYAILDVRETDQTFIPYVWMFMSWESQHISWNPADFCGIKNVSIPNEVLWKPDLTIEEMTEKDRAPPSPHLTIHSDGLVHEQNDLVLVSTCRMHVYQFPFDTQSCNLSFRSIIHPSEEIHLFSNSKSKKATEESKDLMRTQYEWLFININVSSEMINSFGFDQDVIIYTINMKRRSILYIVNFLLPVLFFLFLDLASFLISDNGGEKLSFKVTVLLAVTVLQLILNDILPASSNRIPLIAVYCIGVFGLMMLSLLETIVVMYLMEKDLAPQEDKAEKDRCLKEDKRGQVNFHNCEEEEKKWSRCDFSADETPAEQLKLSSSRMTDESPSGEKLAEDLREAVETLTLLLNRKEEGKPGYWTRKTRIINKVFFAFYLTAATLFLVCMFFNWNTGL
ncbi:5-hydroxytryptamine receptor 3A-like [Hippoglossus hippoglossus]|uniref:5-hydroxytryptamine receptor 3A-like n=1 Tax=Hippoglossus hippoglossus TaxID=8267 RepID=UPI00148B44E7|nr:5-hydroxytryptamine receptor 3A-like [Hippoglossus hippoglossus]